MVFKKKIYINGPRMGTNNYMNGIETPLIKKKRKPKGKKTNGKK